MKDILLQYAGYNLWANQKLTNAILAMDENLYKEPVPSSFPSLHATLFHIWDAESVWWQRMKLEDRIVTPSASTNASMKEVVDGLINQSAQWKELVTSISELKLQHVFEYKNTHKELFKQPQYQVIHHVFNHSTYHRGQLVTMMRVLGETKIPQTDFSVFIRGK
jgi:uncharacterized damage-inducible protein DinB